MEIKLRRRWNKEYLVVDRMRRGEYSIEVLEGEEDGGGD